MKNNDTVNHPTPARTASPDERSDILFEKLRPLIEQCLNLNHDINNPLAGIIGYTELLLSGDEPLSDSQVESIDQIMLCAERIEKEINKLCEIKLELSEEIDIAGIFPDDK